jgi:hypothetical protein
MVTLGILNWMDLRIVLKNAFLFLLLFLGRFGLAKTKNTKRGSGSSVFAEIFLFDMRSVFFWWKCFLFYLKVKRLRFCFRFLSTKIELDFCGAQRGTTKNKNAKRKNPPKRTGNITESSISRFCFLVLST